MQRHLSTIAVALALVIGTSSIASKPAQANSGSGVVVGIAIGAIVGGIIAHEIYRRNHKRHYSYARSHHRRY